MGVTRLGIWTRMTYIQPLDLKNILVTNLAGSMNIFIFLALITIAALAGRFRMPNSIALSMFALFAVLLAVYIPGIYFLIICIGGMVIFYGIGKIIKY